MKTHVFAFWHTGIFISSLLVVLNNNGFLKPCLDSIKLIIWLTAAPSLTRTVMKNMTYGYRHQLEGGERIKL